MFRMVVLSQAAGKITRDNVCPQGGVGLLCRAKRLVVGREEEYFYWENMNMSRYMLDADTSGSCGVHGSGCAGSARILLVALVLFLTMGCSSLRARTVWLDKLDIGKAVCGWQIPQANKSIGGNTLSIAGRKFKRGFGTHAVSALWIKLDGKANSFTAWVGIDDEANNPVAKVDFKILGDKKLLWSSGPMKYGTPAKKVHVSLRGVRSLILIVTDGGNGIDYDHADWADASFDVSGSNPKTVGVNSNVKPYILTPKAGPKPRINGARVFGVRPGRPFFFKVPATGTKPIHYKAVGLPQGLSINEQTGLITGRVDTVGEYKVKLIAENSLGQNSRDFLIKVGDKICLTPPMGWNSWNCWAGAVDDQKVRASAKAMVEKGLIDHGWTYINIDDTWQGKRGGKFDAIQPNKKFPDMKALCDYVHGMGLKIGIYSTPWVTSYAGHVGGSSDYADGRWDAKIDRGRKGWRHGKYPFASNDAKQWAAWGFDYLKYDWNPNDVPHVKEMADALIASGRDIVYSLSNSAPFSHAGDWARLANCWRTTGDIRDTWGSMSHIGFSQNKWVPYAGPGHWNDPDMLVVGKVGWGPKLHPSRLTPDEQYTHISLWCLLSAPLLIGCPIDQIDDFTLSLLTNDEVLDVDQDPLGREASRVFKQDDTEIWAKPMQDGSWVAGLFNRGLFEQSVKLDWSLLKLQGPQMVRDLWRQKNLGVKDGSFQADVPSHGVVLIKLIPAK